MKTVRSQNLCSMYTVVDCMMVVQSSTIHTIATESSAPGGSHFSNDLGTFVFYIIRISKYGVGSSSGRAHARESKPTTLVRRGG